MCFPVFSLTVQINLPLKLYTDHFLVSGQTYKISRGSNTFSLTVFKPILTCLFIFLFPLEGRVQEYLQVFLSTPNSNVNPPSVPTGLSAVEPEFTALGVSFVCLVNYNKQVYGPFYTGILKSLLFSKTSPHPSFSSGPPSDPPVTSS